MNSEGNELSTLNFVNRHGKWGTLILAHQTIAISASVTSVIKPSIENNCLASTVPSSVRFCVAPVPPPTPTFIYICSSLAQVRSKSARALGAMVRGIGESSFEDLLPWLMQTLTSEQSSVDRSGAAQGLSEVVGGLGVQKLHKLMPGQSTGGRGRHCQRLLSLATTNHANIQTKFISKLCIR